jgi:hypothetical protein
MIDHMIAIVMVIMIAIVMAMKLVPGMPPVR